MASGLLKLHAYSGAYKGADTGWLDKGSYHGNVERDSVFSLIKAPRIKRMRGFLEDGQLFGVSSHTHTSFNPPNQHKTRYSYCPELGIQL